MGTLIALDDDLIWVNNGGSSPTPPEPDIPDGTTAIPINDVVIWQKCAGLTQQYDTLAEVLADSGIVRTLMNSKNAVDYLVRSTGFAKSEALVPVMTSNTTPSGVCSGSSVWTSTDYYRAFEGDDLYGWIPYQNYTNNYVSYQFPSNVKFTKCDVVVRRQQNTPARTLKLQYGDSWIDIGTIDVPAQTASTDTYTTFSLSFNEIETDKIRIFCADTLYASGILIGINTIQLYSVSIITNQTAMSYIGANDYTANTLLNNSDWNEAIQNSEYFELVDNAKVPILSQNTSEILSNGQYGDDYPQPDYQHPQYCAFDKDDSTAWLSRRGVGDRYIGYDFNEPVQLCKVILNAYLANNDVLIKGSDDGSNWTTIKTISKANVPNRTTVSFNIFEFTKYSKYITESYVPSSSGSNYTWYGYTIQFYGRCNGGVQSWLTAGGVTDKNYTTLSQILNDPVTLQTLMQSENAVNYLVTCKMWIDEICSNENAMTYIGYSNYASNTLLADSDWRAGICSSAYFESVLNAKVPVMTGNSTPSGECSFTNLSNSGIYSGQPYQAFDGNTSTVCYMSGNNNSFGRFIYKFDSPLKIYRCDLNMVNTYFPQYTNSGSYPRRVVKSSDGTNYTSLKECYSAVVNQSAFSWNFDNDEDAEYFGVELGNINTTQSYTGVRECQFYGRIDI